MYKRIIFALLYSNGEFHLSRNFRLQKVGDVIGSKIILDLEKLVILLMN